MQRNPKMRMRSVVPIFPPPGYNLEIPKWTPEDFLKRIGGGCSEYADKFENIEQVFEFGTEKMQEKGVPAKARRYILAKIEMLRRGVLTFEYLQRRTQFQVLQKKSVTIRYGDQGRLNKPVVGEETNKAVAKSTNKDNKANKKK